MNRTLFRSLTMIVASSWIASASAAPDPQSTLGGRANVYQHLAPSSLEEVSSPQVIQGVGAPNMAPLEIWRRLEQGERTECLDCIPIVSKLIYANHPKTREIAAWWLRRRILGVFGPGQVYEQTVKTLTDQTQPEHKRAYAAEAIGEFLSHAALAEVASALVSDPSPRVRKSAAYALWRMNSAGPNQELAQAIGDADVEVRLQALFAATRVRTFTDVASLVARISDDSPAVRKRAAEGLGAMRANDAVVGLIAVSAPSSEPEASVRAAVVAALGQIGDPAAKPAVTAAHDDPHPFVRDAARIAARRL
jgi:HEAT repeat protein